MGLMKNMKLEIKNNKMNRKRGLVGNGKSTDKNTIKNKKKEKYKRLQKLNRKRRKYDLAYISSPYTRKYRPPKFRL